MSGSGGGWPSRVEAAKCVGVLQATVATVQGKTTNQSQHHLPPCPCAPLRPDDLLSCTAALQLVRDAAEQCEAGMAVQLQAAVAPRLAPLLRHPEPVLAGGALPAGAALLAAALQAGQGPMAVDGNGAGPAGGGGGGAGTAGEGEGEAGEAALLGALKEVLDVASQAEFAPDLEDAALDAGGC